MRAIGVGLLSVAVSAVLLVLALPLGEQHYVAWFAFVPVLAATRGRGVIVGFVATLAAIFLAAGLANAGILYAHRNPIGESNWLYTGFGLFGFAAAIAAAVHADKKGGQKPAWWFAALAVLLESVLLLQLPAHLGLTQYRHPIAMRFAALGGIWLVSFLVWWANFAIARLQMKRAFPAAVAVAALAIGTFYLPIRTGGDTMRGAAIQASSEHEPFETRLMVLHRKAAQEHAQLVVWPESAGDLFQRVGLTNEDLCQAGEIAPFVTSFREAHEPLTYNTAALILDGKEEGRYRKRKLFGAESKMHDSGLAAVSVPFRGSQLGLNICFDSCYPYVMRDTAQLPGVNLIGLPANDPITPHGFIAAMHAAYTPFRAAEAGVPIIRADSIGESMVVDSSGHIVAEVGSDDQLLMADMPTATQFAPARILGDWVLYACAALLVFGLFRKPKTGESEPESGTI